MKISFEKKYFLGFIVILVVVASDGFFITRLNEEGYHNGQHIRLDRISLFTLSIVLLIVVYFDLNYRLIKFHKNYCTKTVTTVYH
jgi:hypothetical protein